MTRINFWCNNRVAQLLGNNISPALDQQYALHQAGMLLVTFTWWLFFQLRVRKRISEPIVFLPAFVAGQVQEVLRLWERWHFYDFNSWRGKAENLCLEYGESI